MTIAGLEVIRNLRKMYMSTPNIKPIGRRILVEKLKPENTETVIDGIIIPPKAEDGIRSQFVEAKVIAIGTAPEFEVKVGDTVLVMRLHGYPADEEDQYTILLEHECLCIINREDAA